MRRAVTGGRRYRREGTAYSLNAIPLTADAANAASNRKFTPVCRIRIGLYVPRNSAAYHFRLRIWCKIASATIPIPSHSCAACSVT